MQEEFDKITDINGKKVEKKEKINIVNNDKAETCILADYNELLKELNKDKIKPLFSNLIFANCDSNSIEHLEDDFYYYKGQIQNKNIKHGQGILKRKNKPKIKMGRWENNSLVEGISIDDKTYYNGKWTSYIFKGIIIYPNGDIFEGTAEGVMHLKGTMIYKDGDISKYEGNFSYGEQKNDKNAIVTYRDGNVWIEHWEFNKKIERLGRAYTEPTELCRNM